LAAVAREVKRVLKKGGRVRFDFADNNIGIYRKLRERLYHIYMRLGIPLDWLGNGEIEAGLKHLETTVDCPDPKNPAAANWTDRSVPHKETIVNTFKEVGLSCREIGRREIKGWDDPQYGSSLNVYYEAVNV
jgi:hypothetical protein